MEPRTSLRPWKCSRQNWFVSKTALGPLGSSSSARNVRPNAGVMANASRKFAETRPACTSVGLDPPSNMILLKVGGVGPTQQHDPAEGGLCGGELLEYPVVAAPGHVVRRGNELAAHARKADRHPDELPGIGVWQRPQQDGVGNTEYGGSGADSPPPREHR